MTNEERMQPEANLIAGIRTKLPDFAKVCADETELMLLHQDAFAADYQEDEYRLLGMAIKYAGLRGKEVRVIGKNRSTLAGRRHDSVSTILRRLLENCQVRDKKQRDAAEDAPHRVKPTPACEQSLCFG